MELTILMPCLNEAETIEACIRKSKIFLEKNNIDGEILISDNGSTDGSIEIAKSGGVRVVHAPEKGYGNALRYGCENAYGKYVIMGDADDSYNFLELMPFVDKLREGYDLVMGNRFKGGIAKGAMPWSHRYIGNPILSFVGRLFFKSSIGDFHCGLRGYNRDSILNLNLKTSGMEYASEMVVMAELNHLKIAEVPTTLEKDGRSRPPHLRSFRDGWRHLKFLFMYSPNWLFLYPGLILFTIGIIGSVVLFTGQLNLFNVSFSIHTFLYFMFFVIAGFDVIDMFFLVKLFAFNHEFLPREEIDWNNKIKEDRFIFIGGVFILLGMILSIYTLSMWKHSGYGSLVPEVVMRYAIPAISLMIIGIQSLFSGFLMGILKIK